MNSQLLIVATIAQGLVEQPPVSAVEHSHPELIVLVELRPGDRGPTWSYAPARFSNRALWLKFESVEVWRAEVHAEPERGHMAQIYTTAYARSFPRTPPADTSPPQ